MTGTEMGNGETLDIRSQYDLASTISHSLVGVIKSGFGPNEAGPFIDGGGNLRDVDPKLGALADNGGPTQTFALLKGSPAIDAALESALESISAASRSIATLTGIMMAFRAPILAPMNSKIDPPINRLRRWLTQLHVDLKAIAILAREKGISLFVSDDLSFGRIPL